MIAACCLVLAAAVPADAVPRTPVAVVSVVSGTSHRVVAGRAATIALFDLLDEGSELRAGPGARLEVAFATGRRFAIPPGARARIGAADVTAVSGELRELEPVPVRLRLPSSADASVGRAHGAIRVRDDRIAGLYPREPWTALADATSLTFDARDDVDTYDVSMRDEDGREVWKSRGPETVRRVAGGRLRPGRRYVWTAAARDRQGFALAGEARFATVDAAAAERRAALVRAVEAAPSAQALALLAQADWELGLDREAHDALQRAREHADETFGRELDDLEARLGARSRTLDGEPAGVVLEEIDPGGVAARAGLRAGDVLLRWRRESNRSVGGVLALPFDVREVEVEHGPRDRLVLEGTRAGQGLTAVVTSSDWGTKTRPGELDGDLLEANTRARALFPGDDKRPAIELWAEAAKRATSPRLAAWLYWRAAMGALDARRFEQADTLMRDAVAVGDALPEPLPALLRETYVRALFNQQEGRTAEGWMREALARRRQTSPGTLALASDLNDLGTVVWKRGRRDEGRSLLEEALALREQAAPESEDVAQTLQWIGRTYRPSDAPRAYQLFLRAFTIIDRAAPESSRWLFLRRDLASMLAVMGDVDEAWVISLENLEVAERLNPRGLGMASVVADLGVLAVKRGDLVSATRYMERASALYEQFYKGTPHPASALELGRVTHQQGDLDRAEDLLSRAEAMIAASNPSHYTRGVALTELGRVAIDRGDFALAQSRLERALAIHQQHVPDGMDTLETYTLLGRVALARHDTAGARSNFDRGLTLASQHPWQAPWATGLLLGLGDVAFAEGRLADADALYRRARQASSAGLATYDVEISAAVARLLERRGRPSLAAAERERALMRLESRLPRAGNSPEERSGFAARYEDLYQEQIALLSRLGRPAVAFAMLERSRARALRTLLAQRDLRSGAGTTQDDERRRLAARHDALFAALGDTRDESDSERLLAQLREVQASQTRLAAESREGAPGTPDSPPLDVARACAGLDPGTLMLSYLVGPERAYLFVLDRAGALDLHTLPVGRDELARDVTAFRDALRAAGPHGPQQADGGLFAQLLRPAWPRVARAARLLVIPDGPLHRLPFGALVVPGPGAPRFLAEMKALHAAPSATVYAQLQQHRHVAPAPAALVAFGDPIYPSLVGTEAPADPVLRDALERGRGLPALPGSRREVEDIARLYPDARTYLGAEATEEHAKQLAPGTRYVHFACHALANDRSPLDSALALTIPEDARGRDNGLLQAWEIMEQVHLDAELVTLASCESGLGKEQRGEGLIGLVRAFQYAGARSVLAALWSVGDADTGELMRHFYGHLRAGRAKDEALRLAQVDLISGGTAPPATWAAFQLNGDWR